MKNIEIENPNPQPEVGFHDHHHPSPSDQDDDRTVVDSRGRDAVEEKVQNQQRLKESEQDTVEEEEEEEEEEEGGEREECYKDEKFEGAKIENVNGEYVAGENHYNGWDDDLVDRGGGYGYGYGYGYENGSGFGFGFGWDDVVENKDNESADESNGYVNDGFSGFAEYPLRPGAEDCAFYIKTGNCKFGSRCKFNHPVRSKPQGAKDKVCDWEVAIEKPNQSQSQSQTECKFYLRTGGCKYGEACRYTHSRIKSSSSNSFEKHSQPLVFDFNFLGLPIRLGEKECPYYMRTGSCKYGANCKFNHPDPTTVSVGDSPLTSSNGGLASQPNSSKSTIPSWSSPTALSETAPYVPIPFPPTQRVPPQGPEWNGFQAPSYPHEWGLRPLPASFMGNLAGNVNVYAHQKPQLVIDEFPERPGQPECSYYMKNGNCKYKSNCKYDHPKNRTSKSAPCALSDKGLPLRPDQNICSYYSRYGICKFGPACRFDHSIEITSSGGSGDYQQSLQ